MFDPTYVSIRFSLKRHSLVGTTPSPTGSRACLASIISEVYLHRLFTYLLDYFGLIPHADSWKRSPGIPPIRIGISNFIAYCWGQDIALLRGEIQMEDIQVRDHERTRDIRI